MLYPITKIILSVNYTCQNFESAPKLSYQLGFFLMKKKLEFFSEITCLNTCLRKYFRKKKTTNKKSHEDACNKFLVISRK